MRPLRLLLGAVLLAASGIASAETLGPGGECVPFARRMSGMQIYGDAWTWWDQAEGRYARGPRPRVGAVLVFRPTSTMPLGHVAVVSRIVSSRIVMVTHANWSRIGGVRGQAERDVTVTDVSRAGDWSEVRVWYNDNEGLGGSIYRIHGFIYGSPGLASPSPELSGVSPDYIGALIDTIDAPPTRPTKH